MHKILLVDDDPLLTEMYSQKLIKDGFEVIKAVDGEQGFQLMPKINGLDVLKKMKEDPDENIQNIPVILLTNLARDMEDISFGLELGAVTYLVKSRVKPDQVVARVKEILQASGQENLPPTAGKVS